MKRIGKSGRNENSSNNCLRLLKELKELAEKVRFELTEAINLGGFQDRCLKPLGHPSKSDYFYSTLSLKYSKTKTSITVA